MKSVSSAQAVTLETEALQCEQKWRMASSTASHTAELLVINSRMPLFVLVGYCREANSDPPDRGL
jgi:hypothetical protein